MKKVGKAMRIFLGEVTRILKKMMYDLFINVLAASILCPSPIRCSIYRLWGMNIKTNGVACRSYIGGKNLTIGNGCNVNYECFFDLCADVIIGDNVNIGARCTFMTATHKIGDENCRCQSAYSKNIVVEDGCWIGTNVVILPGVTIGHGTIISAGSVVKKNCKPNSIYAGNPAKLVVAMTHEAPIM